MVVLEKFGLHRDYVRKEIETPVIRGRLLIKETVLKQWARSAFDRATVSPYDYSRDVLINQAIRYTLWHVLRTYERVATHPDPLILKDLDVAVRAMANVTLDRSRGFLPALRRLLLDDAIPNTRFYMRRLLHLCHMILDDLGIDLEDPKGQRVALPAMVVNMERVFQQFLRLSIRQELQNMTNVDCWNTTREHRHSLFLPAEGIPGGMRAEVAEQEYAEPDFVVAKDGKPSLICDAKYATERHRADVYQVVAHALAYGAVNALLIYPSHLETEVGFTCLGRIGSVTVFVYCYPLDSMDLNEASRAMVDDCLRII